MADGCGERLGLPEGTLVNEAQAVAEEVAAVKSLAIRVCDALAETDGEITGDAESEKLK